MGVAYHYDCLMLVVASEVAVRWIWNWVELSTGKRPNGLFCNEPAFAVRVPHLSLSRL